MILSTFKKRSCMRASPDKFARMPNKKLKRAAVRPSKRAMKRMRRNAASVVNSDLLKKYPPHIFRKDLDDFLRDCRERSEKGSVKTDSINFWAVDECCSDASSVNEPMGVDESTQVDADSTINRYFPNSNNSLKRKIPTSFSDLCVEREDDGVASCGQDKITSSFPFVTKSASRWRTGVASSGNSHSSDDEISPNNCEDDSDSNQHSNAKQPRRPINYLLESGFHEHLNLNVNSNSSIDSQNRCQLDLNSRTIPTESSSKYSVEKLESFEKSITFKTSREMKSKAGFASGNDGNFQSILPKLETQHSNIYTHVERETPKSSENTCYLDQSGKLIPETKSSKIFYEDLRVKLERNRKRKSEHMVTQSDDIHCDALKQCKVQHSASPPRGKKTHFELFEDLSEETNNTAEKLDCETVECQDVCLSSKVPPLKYLAFEANTASESSTSNAKVPTDVSQAEAVPSGVFQLSDACCGTDKNHAEIESRNNSENTELISEIESPEIFYTDLRMKLEMIRKLKSENPPTCAADIDSDVKDTFLLEIIASETFRYFNACSEFDESEIEDALLYISEYVQNQDSNFFNC